MLAPSKRRRISFYSLPLVTAIGSVLVAGLAAWQRTDVIADLADRVAHGEPEEAAYAVRQLAAVPNPPLSILVAAATSDEHKIAEQAQVSIGRLLRRWQRQIEAHQRVSAVASHLARLAEALADERNAFPRADYPWLCGTARKIVRLANQCPQRKTPLVAMHCDAILSVAAARESATTPIAGGGESTGDVSKNEEVKPGDAGYGSEPRQARLERDVSGLVTQPMATENEPHDRDAVTTNTDSSSTQATARESDVPSNENDKDAEGGRSPMIGDGIEQAIPHMDAPLGPMSLPREPALRSEWSQPIFRMLPAMPINVAPSEDGAVETDARDSRSAPPSLRVAAKQPRELLKRWLAGDVNERQALERELAALGLARPSTRLVEKFLSDDPEARLQLVDDVLTERGVDARPWLVLLAGDPNAEVRLLVVTIMATSDDAALVEKAWQMAIRDRDPRIADLAGRLRERRAGTLRR